KVVFDNWLVMEDSKKDTLQIRSDGSFVFLDASACLGGTNWDENARDRLKQWQKIGPCSLYTEAICTPAGPYDQWLSRVSQYPAEQLRELLQEAPLTEWNQTEADVELAKTRILKTADFVARFQSKLLKGDLSW